MARLLSTVEQLHLVISFETDGRVYRGLRRICPICRWTELRDSEIAISVNPTKICHVLSAVFHLYIESSRPKQLMLCVVLQVGEDGIGTGQL